MQYKDAKDMDLETLPGYNTKEATTKCELTNLKYSNLRDPACDYVLKVQYVRI